MSVSRIKLLQTPDLILYLSGKGNYTISHRVDGIMVTHAYTLALFEKDLPTFIRIRRGLLVNPLHVRNFYRRSRLEAFVLIAGQWLPVSRRQVKKACDHFLEKFARLQRE